MSCLLLRAIWGRMLLMSVHCIKQVDILLLIRASLQLQVVNHRLRISMERKGSFFTGAIPLISWPNSQTFWKRRIFFFMGELPGAGEYENFEKAVAHHTLLHEQFERFF